MTLNGPEGLDVMMTTNAVHVVPPRVWKDYLAIAEGEEGLERRLDHYRINTIVISKSLQGPLYRQTRRLRGWEKVYDDEVGLIVSRDEQLIAAAAEAKAASDEAAERQDDEPRDDEPQDDDDLNAGRPVAAVFADRNPT